MTHASVKRLRLEIAGAVQGVGFRPAVHRLAGELGLAGWVLNGPAGVVVDVEGEPGAVDRFAERLRRQPPPAARIDSMESEELPPAGWIGFEIRGSSGGEATALILPDLATCDACREEILDPGDRRHRYPFTNCTDCGPRFSIIHGLPYDRPRTSMARFSMCDRCRAEYEDPADRRFHAQPNACPDCGPRLALRDRSGGVLAEDDNALRRAAAALREGRIVAVKGLGGFHLMVTAGNQEAVLTLRRRKQREAKPLAVMAADLAAARELAVVDEAAARVLASPAAPIVLLERTEQSHALLAEGVVPGANPQLGLMLPYTPLHHLLLGELSGPVVATSGNLSDEPICTDEAEALERLGEIADLFLVHDRPIVRHVDDSVVRILEGEVQVLRRARGYAPLPVPAGRALPPILGVGAHLKNTVALAVGRNVLVSQHVGDLETEPAHEAFREAAGQFSRLYDRPPAAVACDLHPDYLSTRYARETGLPLLQVQHHAAHAYAVLAENNHRGSALTAAWDGTGLGADGTIWGGEFIALDEAGDWHRAARLRTFLLPGGDAAAREPRRSSLGLLHELLGRELTPAARPLARLDGLGGLDVSLVLEMLEKGINSPVTSSAGRLFDAVASLLGIRQVHRYEGQAAMELEWAAQEWGEPVDPWPLPLRAQDEGPLVLDWGPMIEALLEELGRGAPPGELAARFHESLAAAIVETAGRVGLGTVALSGGCFLNRLLTGRAAARLREAGFTVLLHRQTPPGDGCVSLGQVAAGARMLETDERR